MRPHLQALSRTEKLVLTAIAYFQPTVSENGGKLFQGLTFERGASPAFAFGGGKANRLASSRKRVTTQT
jgi:hypothetical protein